LDSTDAAVLLLEAGGSDEDVKKESRTRPSGLRTSARDMTGASKKLNILDTDVLENP
jgi:hypothetical protein